MDKENIYSFLDEVTTAPIPDRLILKDENKVRESLPKLEEPQKDALYLPS